VNAPLCCLIGSLIESLIGPLSGPFPLGNSQETKNRRDAGATRPPCLRQRRRLLAAHASVLNSLRTPSAAPCLQSPILVIIVTPRCEAYSGERLGSAGVSPALLPFVVTSSERSDKESLFGGGLSCLLLNGVNGEASVYGTDLPGVTLLFSADFVRPPALRCSRYADRGRNTVQNGKAPPCLSVMFGTHVRLRTGISVTTVVNRRRYLERPPAIVSADSPISLASFSRARGQKRC